MPPKRRSRRPRSASVTAPSRAAPAPILLRFVLGPRFEENFRPSLLISRGDLMTFIERPISAFFLFICVVLLSAQIYVWLRKPKIVQEEKALEAQVSATPYSGL